MLVLVAAGILLLVADLRVTTAQAHPALIDGPYARLLAGSTDLGPARADRVQLTALLNDRSRPEALTAWAVGGI